MRNDRPEKWEYQVMDNYNKARVHKALFFPFRLAFEKAGIKV